MADNLPLIPNKQSVCADVRPLLREVFRELDYLPPLTATHETAYNKENHDNYTLQKPSHWVDEYSSQCEEIWQREGELKQEYAKRLSRDPLPNIYKLHSSANVESQVTSWKKERGILQRRDLIPTVIQDARGSESVWVRNILNRSSCDVSSVNIPDIRIPSAIILIPPDENTIKSISISEVVTRPLPEPSLSTSSMAVVTSQPEHVVCVPPKLDFINFTVGRVHAQIIRLVNVSISEVRLSVRPPQCTELLVQVISSRGLCVTSGASARLRVQFLPREVRPLCDRVRVRLSTGGELCVPIECYMQPPLLHILVPNGATSCTPEDVVTCQAMSRGCDVLELGARLLGDEHNVLLNYHCESDHASFFLLAEEDWFSFCVNNVTSSGVVLGGAMRVWPARWAGGGAVQARCWCRARVSGLQVAQFHLLCSTGVVRRLHVLADALLFRPEHLTLLAHEKDYDICSEDDPACEYFLHLGTAFPGRALASTVLLLNHSPLTYTYCWKERPWGVCSCWEGEKLINESLEPDEINDRLCTGVLETRDKMKERDNMKSDEVVELIRIEPAEGEIEPRSLCALHISTPDVGTTLGVNRAVLMFVLKNIPTESLPTDYDPIIISCKTLESEPMPGVEGYTREICDLVCFQLEVWWEVVPFRFVLDPPVLPLCHSLRVQQLEVLVNGAQQFGRESIQGSWSVPERLLHSSPLDPAVLTPAHSVPFRMQLRLPALPTHGIEQNIITLAASNDEWKSRCIVTRQCKGRDAAMRPVVTWLGVVPSGAHLHASLEITNDTYHQLEWKGECMRWVGAQYPCRSCDVCQNSGYSCEMLCPKSGLLAVGEQDTLHYNTNAPQRDGLLVTLVQCGARAVLVAARSLAPRLVLRVLPCTCDAVADYGGCSLDKGASKSMRGSSTLRPRVALTRALRTCYRVRLSNPTPLPTTVTWEPPLEGDDILKVIFIPNCVHVGKHADVEIKVVLEARAVCARRLFLRRARVAGARNPLYLIIDTAITGLEVVCEIPTGVEINTDSFVAIRRTEREKFPWNIDKPSLTKPEEIFSEHDRLRVLQKEHTCSCPYKMLYIPPKTKPRSPSDNPDEFPPIEIVWEPPPLTHVCACSHTAKPTVPELIEPCYLQFINLPLRTVRSRSLVFRNESVISAHWTATLRYHPRNHRRTLNAGADEWARDGGAAGLAAECAPREGLLGPRGRVLLDVRVYAHCWGFYKEQLLLQIEKLDPIIVDVWVEAVGPPLQFALNPADTYGGPEPVLWVSASDPEHRLLVRNISRSELKLEAYTLTEHEHHQDVLPFRLYLRLFDVPPQTCPCLTTNKSEHNGESISETQSSCSAETETAVELYLAPDHGIQTNDYFLICPELLNISAGDRGEFNVTLRVPEHSEIAPQTKLLFRISPVDRSGASWYRPDPPSQAVLLRQTLREGSLKVFNKEIRVKICALDLPLESVMRVRKSFQVRNIGNGPLEVNARTSPPWTVVSGLQHAERGRARCSCGTDGAGERVHHVVLYLEARSSTQMYVEVSIKAEDMSCEVTQSGLSAHTTPLLFYDADNILLKLPLVVEVDQPVLCVNPPTIDFGCVTDGDTRKSYFAVSHSSPSKSLELVTQWVGGEEFRVWPPSLLLQPGECSRVYVQYTARWCGAPAEGRALLSCRGRGEGRCTAEVWCRGFPARDYRCSAEPHDHTDDTHLVPGNFTY